MVSIIIRPLETPVVKIDYKKKIDRLWNFLFFIYGLRVNRDSVNSMIRVRCILVTINTTLQAFTLLHYLVAAVYGLKQQIVKDEIAFFINFLNIVMSVLLSVITSLILQYRKEKFRRLYTKLALSCDNDFIQSLYKTTAVYLGLTALVPMCSVISACFGYNGKLSKYYNVLLFVGGNLSDEMLYYVKYLMLGQFLFILAFDVYFVDSMIVYFANVCKMVARHFWLLNQKLQILLLNGRNFRMDELNRLRQRHEQICDLVREMNELFSPLIVIWLLVMTVSLCVDIRAVSMVQFTAYYNIFFVCKVTDRICLLVLLFKAASRVNNEAHFMSEKSLTSIIMMPHNEDKLHHYDLNYILFCLRLGNTNIGISASGLFLLNATSFLSLTGSVITYVIVLTQSS
uniref:Gustatory receptor n=1 Tax=Strigamia maritima TaxID=126957 RepID=T1IP29_STRMM